MKKKMFFAFGAISFALALGAIGTSFSKTNVARADSSALDAAYGSFQDNESIKEQFAEQTGGGWTVGTNIEFTLNDAEWIISSGRYSPYVHRDKPYARHNTVQLIAQDADNGMPTPHNIATVDESDPFYELGQAVVASNTYYGEGQSLSALMLNTPVTLNENIAFTLNDYGSGEISVYVKLLDANDEYYVQNTWKKLRLPGSKETYIQNGDTSWAWNAFEFNRVEDTSTNDWGINNLKEHQIQVAFVLRSWTNTVGAAFTSVTIDAYDSTVAMLNKFANLNPEKDLCNSLAGENNVYKNELIRTQHFLTEADLEALSETAIEGEFTSYTTALSLLNYLNENAGIAQYQTQITSLIGNNPYTLVVMVLILTMTLAAIGLIVYKRRKIKA